MIKALSNISIFIKFFKIFDFLLSLIVQKQYLILQFLLPTILQDVHTCRQQKKDANWA